MTKPVSEDILRLRLAAAVPTGVFAHIERVVAVAGELAEVHGLDVPRARLAALGHDVLRAVPPAELLARAEACALPLDPVERAVPVILHGPLGALELHDR